MTELDQRVLPAAVADDRGRAVLAMMTEIGASFDWRPALALTLADIPGAMLPHAVRAFAVQDYVEPGLKEIYVRRVVENALTIKAREGTIRGVRTALGLLGMTVSWTQWHKMTPRGAPGTHTIVVEINERLFDGEPLLSERSQMRAKHIVETVKRHSQDVAFSIAAATHGDIGVGTAGVAPMQWVHLEAVAA